MTIFRPSNINKRLVGTTDKSPGNGGQIGPDKTPYCLKGICNSQINLGQRFFNGGSACGGIFKPSESLCGLKEKCNVNPTDCGGYFVCCGPSTAKWFVSPACTEVSRCWNCKADAVTCADSLVGSCGWFVPQSMSNPGYVCRQNWDSFSLSKYWGASVDGSGHYGGIDFATGVGFSRLQFPGTCVFCVRAFRCTST